MQTQSPTSTVLGSQGEEHMRRLAKTDTEGRSCEIQNRSRWRNLGCLLDGCVLRWWKRRHS